MAFVGEKMDPGRPDGSQEATGTCGCRHVMRPDDLLFLSDVSRTCTRGSALAAWGQRVFQALHYLSKH